MRIRSNRGFTLTELLVVLSLLGVILAVVFAAVEVTSKGNAVADRQAQFSNDISDPLQAMDKIFSQNTAVLAGDAYTVVVNMPYNPDDGYSVRYMFAADTAGVLTQTLQHVNGGTVLSSNSRILSRFNGNRASGTPLFLYIDGSNITTVPVGARAINIQIVSTKDGRSLTGQRQVYFRNR